MTHAPLYSVLRDLIDRGLDDATVAQHLMARPDAADIALTLAQQAAARMRRTKMRDIEQSVHEAVTVAQARSPRPEPGAVPPTPPGLNGLDPAVLTPYLHLVDVDVYVSAARGRVRWGDMTVEDHLARAAVFDRIIAGNESSRLRHLRLADFLRRTGAPTLNDLLALAGIP